MELTVKERLIIFLKHKKISQNKFEKTIGAGNGFVNNISKSIGGEKLQSIICNYPELNSEWLMTGHGKMIKDEEILIKNYTPLPTDNEAGAIIAQMFTRLDKKDEQIDKLIETISSQQRTIEKYVKNASAQLDDNAAYAAADKL